MSKKKRNTIIMGIVGSLISLIWIYPFYLVFINSIKIKSEIFTNTLNLPENLTWGNYPEAFAELEFTQTLFNSILITTVSIFLVVVCSSMAAYALSRNKSKISGFVYFLLAIVMLIPFQSIMIPLISIFGKVELLNRTGLIFMYLGLSTSMAVILYSGALRGISTSLDEAAIIDGANRFQIFRFIIFPMLKPSMVTVIVLYTCKIATVTVIVLNAIWIWNDYLLPSLVINKEGMYTIPLKMFYFFGEYSKQWHLALAALVLAIIPIIILYMFLQKHIIKG